MISADASKKSCKSGGATDLECADLSALWKATSCRTPNPHRHEFTSAPRALELSMIVNPELTLGLLNAAASRLGAH